MTARPWPVDRARAWLLRRAAEMVERGGRDPVVAELLAEVGDADSVMLSDEAGFRQLLLWSDAFQGATIDRIVAEVYGEAAATSGGTMTPTPAEVAAAWEKADRAWFASTERVHTPDGLLERARGAYCATAVIQLFSERASHDPLRPAGACKEAPEAPKRAARSRTSKEPAADSHLLSGEKITFERRKRWR